MILNKNSTNNNVKSKSKSPKDNLENQRNKLIKAVEKVIGPIITLGFLKNGTHMIQRPYSGLSVMIL